MDCLRLGTGPSGCHLTTHAVSFHLPPPADRDEYCRYWCLMVVDEVNFPFYYVKHFEFCKSTI